MPRATDSTGPKILPRFGASLVEWIIVGSYAYFFLIIFLEVVMRYFFSYSTTWGR